MNWLVSDSALLLLAGIVLAVLVLAVLFSLYAILLRVGHSRRERLQAELRDRWEGPILAAIADPARVADVHPMVPQAFRMHFVQFVLDYARRVRGAERATLRRLVEPYLDEIAQRTDHSRAEVRTRAVQTLGTLGLPKYSKEVLAGLEDPSPLVSMVSARYLARPEFPEYGPALMEHLERFEGWNRFFLASMLAEMGPEVSPVLRDGLVDDAQPPWLRAVFAEALRMQVDARSADPAVEALGRGVEHRDLTASLLRLLAAVGRPEHVDVVRPLCEVEDEIVRAQAFHALGMLGDQRELPRLFGGMDDESPWVTLHAARGAREAGGADRLRAIADEGGDRGRLAGQVLFEEEDR